MNVFFQPFPATNGMVPFDQISINDYLPAIQQGIKEQNDEIRAIVEQKNEPNFDNTIVALERSGSLLDRTLNIFYPMLSAHADDALQALANEIVPLIDEHQNNIFLNEALWLRVKHVNEHFAPGDYDAEDGMLLKKTVMAFERSGATLVGEQREEYRRLSKKLSELSLKFEQNHLKETNRGELWLTEADLDGLPADAIEAAAQAAHDKGRDDEFLFTLHAPSYTAFMTHSSRRDLRERLYKLYNRQGTQGAHSNLSIVNEIANTRLAIAQLFGYKTFADYRLQNSMAGTPQAVTQMLEQLREAYLPKQKQEMRQLEDFASQLEGRPMTIKPWDYSYYNYQLKDAIHQVNDELLKPYFKLENVMEGVFGLATKLYGLKFAPNHEAPVFHPEVRVYDVTRHDGRYVGSIYTDFFPRPTKQSGAWMTCFREQCLDMNGQDVRPLVSLTMNFTRPTASKPSLLTLREVETFVHEFGHGLHSLLSQCKYVTTSGTHVYRDFVEMPSQFHENYVTQQEFLDSFARHYLTSEPIPQELIERMVASSRHGAGYACIRQLGFGFLDMGWHTLSEPYLGSPFELEHQAMKSVEIFSPIDGCLMSTQFGHIFSGGYAAGYYGYKWAEVLDADAFSKFQEDGIFNPATAQSFRDNILSRGGSEPPMTLYTRFRGRGPRIDALLRRDGISPQSTCDS